MCVCVGGGGGGYPDSTTRLADSLFYLTMNTTIRYAQWIFCFASASSDCRSVTYNVPYQ